MTDIPTNQQTSRCGYIALVGRPNAGKSTFFNSALGQRLSIVTPKPQTTRSRILGILTRANSQMIFLDTPGLLEASYKLHETMGQQIDLAAREADAVLLLLDGTRPQDRNRLIKNFIGRNRAPLIVALNKIDLLSASEIQGRHMHARNEFGLDEVAQISALKGDNLETLLDNLETLLPYGPQLYPEDIVAEQPERFFVAEFIREAAFNSLNDELPYSINVTIDEFVERSPKTYIRATLHVERDSQKGIVIGHRGERLRHIGKEARTQIESFLDGPVFLELWVKVRPDWRNNDGSLREFGYR
jgi:GTPase